MGLCQLKSSSRVSVRERLWHDGPIHPPLPCWPRPGPMCYGRSMAMVVPFVLRLARSLGLSPVFKLVASTTGVECKKGVRRALVVCGR